MNTIIHYIINGKGYGLKFLTLFSVIFALVFGGIGYHRINEYLNSQEVQSFVANIPVLEIKNQKLVEPHDSYVVLEYPELENAFFVINTRAGDLDLMNFETAFYLTPDRAYIKTGNNIQTTEYDEDMIITPDFIRQALQMTTILMPLFFVVFLLLFIWVGYGFLYVISKLFSWIIKRPLSGPMRGRIVLLSWISILLIDFILSFVGLGFSLSMAFVWAFIFIALILLKISDSHQITPNT